MNSFSRFISLIFHPIFLPLYMAIIILYSSPILFQNGDLILFVIALLTIGFPLIAVLIMKGLDIISSFEMEDPKERFIPMIVVATILLWTFFMLKPGGKVITASHPLLSNMVLGSIISLFIMFPLNSLSKISFHAVGMGGLVGMLMNVIPYASFNLIGFFVVAILLAGLVGTARLFLKAHTIGEIFGGFFIGFLGQFLAYTFWGQIAGVLNF